MNKKIILATLFSLNAISAFAIDWQNPPVMCPEEILPKGITCPDFSKVENVYTDYPDSFSTEDIKEWKNNKAADLRLCRNKEVLKRESAKAGTYNAGTIENAWMVVNGGEKVQEKLEAVQSASVKYQIPPQVLMGAMRQESLLSSLGVSPDGGNYSCGMSQLNIQEWCNSINKLSAEEKTQLGWPLNISCEETNLPTDIVKPFYDIAVLKLGNRPSYQLTSADFQGITFDQVSSSLSGSEEAKKDKFQAISSFVNHCQDIKLSVDFKARTLRGLFLNFVPKELREKNTYREGETFTKQCASPYMSNAYPLHTGWLLAVAMYNAGPRQRALVDHYFQIKDNNYPSLTPLDLIEALHWGGKAKKRSDLLEFKDQDNNKLTQKWFKSCIVQRHVARVIQHATLPAESIAKSLEQDGCKNNGEIPDYRKKSSGVK
jgi:hypothetical protein